MEVILAILAFIWSVLGIILFAKVWNMTNDVKVIKNILLTIPDKLSTTNRIIASTDGNSSEVKSEPIMIFEEGDEVVNIETGEELIVAQVFPDGDVSCKPKGFGLRKLVRITNLKKLNQ